MHLGKSFKSLKSFLESSTDNNLRDTALQNCHGDVYTKHIINQPNSTASTVYRKVHRFIPILDFRMDAQPLKEINESVCTYLSAGIDLTTRVVCDEQ